MIKIFCKFCFLCFVNLFPEKRDMQNTSFIYRTKMYLPYDDILCILLHFTFCVTALCFFGLLSLAIRLVVFGTVSYRCLSLMLKYFSLFTVYIIKLFNITIYLLNLKYSININIRFKGQTCERSIFHCKNKCYRLILVNTLTVDQKLD